MDRIENELAHGRKISGNPEFYWGWSGVAGRLRAERRAAIYISAGRLSPGRTALEIGCGTGIFTSLLSRSGASVTAVDLSPELIGLARERHSAPNVNFVEMNVEKLAFPDDSFDCLCGSSVLHHLDLRKALPEMLRVLKPGGAFVFTEPNMLNPQIMLQKNIPLLKSLMGDSPNETAFFRWGIKKTLLRTGFAKVEVRPFDFLHPWTPWGSIAAKVVPVLERIPLLQEIAGSLQITATK
ncbi:MAG: class I SAM-dependent methyltransferase [Elusimicrobiales bacterium]|nr:class I SAM-dependent methyltransferase [Elusimicrobiales bacterium]